MEFPIITTDIISIDSSKIKDCNDNSKFVIIYGENGSGKTTFSECLRIQNKNENKYSIKFINLDIWKDKQFYIYNKHFVNQNIFNNNSEFSNIANIVIGNNLISLYNNIINDYNEIRKIDEYRNKLKNDLNIYKKEIEFEESNLKNEFTDEYEKIIKLSNEEIISIIEELKNKIPENIDSDLNTIVEYKKLDLNINKNLIIDILNKEIKILDKEIEKEILKFCEFIKSGIKWYKEGLESLENTNNECPFCHQNLNDIETKKLIDNYKTLIYNEEATILENQIKNLLEKLDVGKINNIIDDNIIIYNKMLDNNMKIEIDIGEKLSILINDLVNSLNKKLENPNLIIKLDNINNIINILNVYTESIEEKNKLIKIHNDNIKEKFKNLENKSNIEKLINIYSKLLENKETYIKKLDEIINNKRLKEDTEIKLEEMNNEYNLLFNKNKDNMREYEKSAQREINKYSDKINELLKFFYADFIIKSNFEILKDARSKKSIGEIKAQYTIERNDNKIDMNLINYSLSESEKNLLGLCFFLAQLPENDENGIIIFDDPVTSFDMGRAGKTSEYIYNIKNFYKVIILTHSKDFATKLFYDLEGKVICLELKSNKFNKNKNPSKIIYSDNYLNMNSIIEEYYKFLNYKKTEDADGMYKHARKIIEEIFANAYLYNIDEPEKLKKEYQITSLNRYNDKRSLLKKIENLGIFKELIELYEKLSKEEHGSNNKFALLEDSEKPDFLHEVIEKIKLYFNWKHDK